MKLESVECFIAAILVHTLILFGFQLKTRPAHPLAISDETAPVNVNLVESAPDPMSSPVNAQVPAEPSPPPQASISAPPPTPEAPASAPTAEEMSESTPATSPRKQALRLREVRYPVAHTAAGSAAATLFHTAAHNLSSNGIETSITRYLNNPKPEYPEIARQLRQQGVSLLGVEVGADGHPNQVSLSKSSGFPLLDHAAIRAVRRWTFRPARAGDVPVSSHVEVPVRFSLAD